MSIDANERAVFAALADMLIPASEGFPSASEAGVAAEGLDEVLLFRPGVRSEERRVGEEGRSRWAAYHLKKKNKQLRQQEQRHNEHERAIDGCKRGIVRLGNSVLNLPAQHSAGEDEPNLQQTRDQRIHRGGA